MTTAYVEERQPPRVPTCARATIELLFDGRHLSATGTREALRFPAVSGKPDAAGKFSDSPERQKLKGRGPIPAGRYWIQPSQTWENNWLKGLVVAPRAAWGNYRIAIHPFSDTNTFDRGGFFIHGGTVPGSAGCIDLTTQIDQFIAALKRELHGLPECYIHLTVRYPASR